MTLNQDPNNKGLEVQSEIYGYQIQSIQPLKEINGFLYQLVHLATGARHLHISTSDKENTFGVTFKTVPSDSTGVAHILEHTVLCGSEKYPVRDPFFSMLKRSLSTFMNAFTASDWTMYPFSTQNPKDYDNLMDVYLDAAFFPNIDALSFKQEGHRLEMEKDPNAENGLGLVYKGVVYNEMKGAMSSPDQVMARSILNALYPDTTYSNNSGGDPKIIPQLTHGQLNAFHRRHYHPSNAFFYTYGNLPLAEHLKFISAKIMKRFEAIDPMTDVPMQPRWREPKSVRYTYALAPNEDPSHKSQVCMAWLVGDICDTFDVLVMTVLEQVLLGNAASPLRKALMDSGLGSALSDGTGFDADNRDTLFACGLKDTDEASAEKIEKIILDVFQQLTTEGIERELVESAIHQIEFHRKEITNTPYPYGLKLLLTIIGSWLHGGDPGRTLQLDADLKTLQKKIDAGPFLENCIKNYFIDNPHRIRLVLVPDQQKTRKEEVRTKQELENRMARLSPAQRDEIIKDASSLQALQESEEDLSCLPTLELTDIPSDVPSYTPSGISSKVPLWTYAQPTSGILYFSGTASAAVDDNLLPWVPFFCYAFTKIGTEKSDYTEIARKIDAVTGGVTLSAQARAPWNQPKICLPLISLKAKCLSRNMTPMLDLIEELIGSIVFKDLKRLKQLLGEYQAGLEAMIVHNGHRLAISLSSRAFSPAGALSETWSGVHQVRTIRHFNKQDDPSALQTLAGNLTAISRAIFKPDNFLMAAIGEQDIVQRTSNQIETGEVLSGFSRDHRRMELSPLDFPADNTVPHEGWTTSTAVAFVAQTLPAVSLGHADAPALAVLGKMLRSLYLHGEIREKGGAYGGFALYNPENGSFSLASYRDPHIHRTLKVFDGVWEFVTSGKFEKDDIKEAVLQVCSEIDKPDPPGPAAQKAFSRMIIGLKDEERIKFKQQLLQVTPQKLTEVADHYFKPESATPAVAVIAGEDHLKKANEALSQHALKINVI
ncbi:MAG: insulinase family protein [Desulfobacteraceae bacterium]|jgi:Zn-dependent M16 (insulinase) family peptidase